MASPTNFHMSLAYVILNKFELNQNFYKCPANWSSSEEDRVRRPFLGVYFMASGCILLILYILCFISMLQRDLMKTPAYKIMICLALCDIPSILVNSIVTGFFGYFGLTFCDYPRFIFVCGAHGFGLWMGCCITCITLALCRISEMNTRLNFNWIFHSAWMNVILLLFFIAPVYGTYFNKPILLRPEFMSWFYDPGLGLDPDYYVNLNMFRNNAGSSVITTSLYACLIYFMKQEGAGATSQQVYRAQRSVMLQAACICSMHSCCSMMYVYMQFFYSPAWLIVGVQVGWQFSTGFVSVIYLTLNKTIRSSVVNLVVPDQCRLQAQNQVHISHISSTL